MSVLDDIRKARMLQLVVESLGHDWRPRSVLDDIRLQRVVESLGPEWYVDPADSASAEEQLRRAIKSANW